MLFEILEATDRAPFEIDWAMLDALDHLARAAL